MHDSDWCGFTIWNYLKLNINQEYFVDLKANSFVTFSYQLHLCCTVLGLPRFGFRLRLLQMQIYHFQCWNINVNNKSIGFNTQFTCIAKSCKVQIKPRRGLKKLTLAYVVVMLWLVTTPHCTHESVLHPQLV